MPKNAIDGKDDTRWTSGPQKEPGDWFKIDMKTPQRFSTIILDTSKSPNDSPAKYELYVSNDDIDWGNPVASGIGGGMLTIINFPTQNARYFKIIQTGDTKTNYWSIHEVKVLWDGTETGIKTDLLVNCEKVYYTNGTLYLGNFNGTKDIHVYNLNGYEIFSCQTEKHCIPISLPKGIYGISIQNKEKYYQTKLIVK